MGEWDGYQGSISRIICNYIFNYLLDYPISSPIKYNSYVGRILSFI